MAKLMIVTVGASLFHSASWDKNHAAFQKILGDRRAPYEKLWCLDEESKGLRSPEYRKKNDSGLQELFEHELTPDNAETWATWLAPYDGAREFLKLRYSAEIATILSLAETEARATGQTLAQFLGEYEIYFFHDNDGHSPTFLAAQHNAAYLRKLAGLSGNVKCKGISKFSGHTPSELMSGLKAYLELLANARKPEHETIDIVISGGFKAYGLVGNVFLADERFRVIYLHEELPEVIVQTKHKLKVPGAHLEIPLPTLIG